MWHRRFAGGIPVIPSPPGRRCHSPPGRLRPAHPRGRPAGPGPRVRHRRHASRAVPGPGRASPSATPSPPRPPLPLLFSILHSQFTIPSAPHGSSRLNLPPTQHPTPRHARFFRREWWEDHPLHGKMAKHPQRTGAVERNGQRDAWGVGLQAGWPMSFGRGGGDDEVAGGLVREPPLPPPWRLGGARMIGDGRAGRKHTRCPHTC